MAPLSELGEPATVLGALGALAKAELPVGYSTPITLRLRLPDGAADAGSAEGEVRFKLVLPRRSMTAGAGEVGRLAGEAVRAFERILQSSELVAYRVAD